MFSSDILILIITCLKAKLPILNIWVTGEHFLSLESSDIGVTCQAAYWSGVRCSFSLKSDFLPEASFGLQLSPPASVCLCVCVSLRVNHLLVRPIARDPFKLWSPKIWTKDAKDLKISRGGGGQSTLSFKVKFIPCWACLHHNSLPIQARITKFGPEVENSLVKIPIVLDGNWPWSIRSHLILKIQFSGLTPTGYTLPLKSWIKEPTGI